MTTNTQRDAGRFVRGYSYSPATQFKPGEHWRQARPWWMRDWLCDQYISKKLSAQEIAAEHGCGENNILFWLKRHGIPARSVSECRRVKKWGPSGEKNPMFGRRGCLSPAWRGGLTPSRQKLYSRSEWQSAARKVRKRDKSCRLCGGGEGLQIHHIYPISQFPLLALDQGNLIRLCKRCHDKMKNKEMRYAKKLLALVGGDPKYGV